MQTVNRDDVDVEMVAATDLQVGDEVLVRNINKMDPNYWQWVVTTVTEFQDENEEFYTINTVADDFNNMWGTPFRLGIGIRKGTTGGTVPRVTR